VPLPSWVLPLQKALDLELEFADARGFVPMKLGANYRTIVRSHAITGHLLNGARPPQESYQVANAGRFGLITKRVRNPILSAISTRESRENQIQSPPHQIGDTRLCHSQNFCSLRLSQAFRPHLLDYLIRQLCAQFHARCAGCGILDRILHGSKSLLGHFRRSFIVKTTALRREHPLRYHENHGHQEKIHT